MKMYKQFSLAILSALLLAVGTICVVGAGPGGRPLGHGYFNDNSREDLPWRRVFQYGLVDTGSNKQAFIDQIIGKYNSSGARSNNKSIDADNRSGAEFIIQTMRGANPNFDHGRPTAADIADWKSKINDASVSVSVEKYTYSTNSGYMYTNDDNAFYSNGGRFDSFVFKVGGVIKYAVKIFCGNPVGDLPGLPPTKTDQSSDGSSSSSGCQPMNIVVTPANDYNGKAIPVKVTTQIGDGPPTTIGTYSAATTKDVTSTHTTGDTYTVTYTETGSWISGYTLNSKIVNKKLITWWVTDYTDARSSTSTIGPCYGYQLTPGVTVNFGSGIIEPGTAYNVSATVTNGASGGYATKSKNTQWQLSKLVIPAGPATVPTVAASGIVDAAPCTPAVYVPLSSGIICTKVTGDDAQVFAKSSPTSVYNQDLVIGDQPVGTRICYGLSVIPNAATMPAVLIRDDYWRHTQPEPQTKCLIIGKRPKVQVLGGDLSVGKAFSAGHNTGAIVQTSTTKKVTSPVPGSTQFTFGSWIEYAIYATGQINGAASGSYYADIANGMPSAIKCSPSGLADARALSFTLATPSICTSIGGYKQTQSIPNFAASYTGSGVVKPAGSTLSTSSLTNSASKIYSVSGDLTLSENLALNHSVILKVNGTVTIAGDQKYVNGPYARASQLPQLVIIAKSIIIQAGVGQVDAWLISTDPSGSIDTCHLPGNLSSGKCQNQLTINGPIMAKKLYLRRTFGSEVAGAIVSGTPAEIINLRPDAYLWAQAQAASSGRVQTVYTTELPPRI